ncbi:macrophage mannose receptor 1 isoform X2 [Hippoglossus hippoglossus]|uniref:macrophage mannose receptor 1 isoform X2 n=1 Tax=Hippoglossus hippoglossus TaxID=8267 RepID=UPI00148D1E7A|nr:macrophage mannose receptor 1 isoform X2 [Hippoglossus hippoglossus]
MYASVSIFFSTFLFVMIMTENRSILMKRSPIFDLILITGFSSFTVGSSDFHFIDVSKNYEEAKSYCRATYTDLATVHNLADMKNLTTLVSTAADRAWIGLEARAVRMWHWSWPDHPVDFLNWKAGQPLQTNKDACAALDQRGKWFESDCRTKRRFVCRGNSESSPPMFIASKKSWRNAQTYCRNLLLDLVNILSEKQNEAAHNVSTSQIVWIGLFKDPWEWLDGSNSSFRYWKPGQPNYQKDQDCTAAIFRDEGQWNDRKCRQQFKFICQGARKLIPTTTSLTTTQKTTTTSQLPTNATTLPNTSPQEVMTTFTSTTPTKQPNTTNVTTEGETTATDTTTANTTDVVHSTSSTEVNNTTHEQVTTTTQSTTQLSTLTSTGNNQSVPPGNLILVQQNMTWIDAMTYCRERHNDLVHVTTREIQEEVAEKAKNATSPHVWLGLRYTCKLNFWFWTRSTSACYQNWAPRQGPERTYDCGVTGAIEATGRQQWVGLPETESLNFICSACAG